jgi:hypothetical protein
MVAGYITEREWVSICMAELCRKAGFADCHRLVQRELQFLCDSIETKTGVLISLSTMKRLLNGQFSRQPQSATLNAICSFLGYQHWQDFKLHKLNETNGNRTEKESGERSAESEGDHSSRHLLSSGLRRYYFFIACLVAVTALGLLAFLGFKKHGSTQASGFEKAQFAMTKTTHNDLPNTVVFNYNLDEVMADSFFIQQSWDRDRRVRIDKKNHTLTDIYYEPGYHVAKLIANDSSDPYRRCQHPNRSLVLLCQGKKTRQPTRIYFLYWI